MMKRLRENKHESKGQKDVVWCIEGAIQQTMVGMISLLPTKLVGSE